MKIEIKHDTDGMGFVQLTEVYVECRKAMLAVDGERNRLCDQVYELMENLRLYLEDPSGKYNVSLNNGMTLISVVNKLENLQYPWRDYFVDEDLEAIDNLLNK